MRTLPFAIVIAAGVLTAQQNPTLRRLETAARKAPLVVAHRGNSSVCPENTIAAFEDAVAVGADVVEFDVHQTKDAQWVCIHDDTVDRTTDAKARLGRTKVKVTDLTLAEIRELDAGSWRDASFAGQKVPTLAEALDAILPKAVPMIERKGGDPKSLAAELRRLDVVDRVLVQAFDWEFLGAVHAAEPRLLIGALGSGEFTAERHRELSRTGAKIVHWSSSALTVEAAAAVHEADQLLCTYTVDPDMTLIGAAAIGCELITTNKPARMLALRQQKRLRR